MMLCYIFWDIHKTSITEEEDAVEKRNSINSNPMLEDNNPANDTYLGVLVSNREDSEPNKNYNIALTEGNEEEQSMK